MNGFTLLIGSAVIFLIAYVVYGSWLAKQWGIDPKRKTPAETQKDGIDYLPTKPAVLLGHHFSSIAGAGPIVGPITAAVFGWVPVTLWIIVGSVFFGGVHDYGSLVASLRHKGKSIGQIIEANIGERAKILFAIFAWITLLVVIAAFANIVAATFVANPSAGTSSLLFILLAVAFGLLVYRTGISLFLGTVLGLIGMAAAFYIGHIFPIVLSKDMWLLIMMGYIFVASIAPVWILLQPRDYLNSFLLLFMIGAAAIGIVVANPAITLPVYTGFTVNGMSLFPILFVTVACGAVSGFHSLVSSGTTSKQLSNERDMRLIGFGSMLLEGFLAVIALIAVGALYNNGMPKGTPPIIFANGVAAFLGTLGISENASRTLITLAVSAFALTSLDSVARIGRLSFQELLLRTDAENTGLRAALANKYVATFITLVLGYLLSLGGYMNIWALFGASNQLLGALALIAVCVFMKRTGRNGKMLVIPMIAMLVITLSALGQSIISLIDKIGTPNFVMMRDGLQLVFAVLLTALALIVAGQSFRVLGSVKQADHAA